MGNRNIIHIRKLIQRRIRHQREGVDAVGDVNAVISANVNEGSSHSHVSTRSRQRVAKRSGRTRKNEKRSEEATTMSRAEDSRTETEPPGDEAESADVPEPATPPIDEDVTGSVNAAVHDADE